MHLRTIGLIVLGVAITPNALSANRWIAAGATNLWTDVDNWSEGVTPPDATTHPNFGWDDPAGPFYPLTPDSSDDFPLFVNEAQLTEEGTTTLIDETVTNAATYGLYVGFDGANNVLEMTGGSLEVGGWHLNIGRVFNKSGNPDSKAIFVMSGGTVKTGIVKIPEQFVDNSLLDPGASAPLNGELLMTGGTLNTRIMKLGQLQGNGTAKLSGDAVVNLETSEIGGAGFLEFNGDWNVGGVPTPGSGNVSFDVSDNAVVNIFGHIDMLLTVPDEAEVARYQGYVDNGWLTAWGGTAEPVITLENEVITITAPSVVGVPGDYNNDGAVNAADFTVWRDNLGATLVLNGENPDAATPGLVDQEDYEFWKASFATVSSIAPFNSSQAIPEPTAWSLICFIGTTGGACYLYRISKCCCDPSYSNCN